MSATITAVVAAWRVAGPETRELVAMLLRAAWGLNRALAVPPIDPGWERPESRMLTAQSTPEQVEVALDTFDVLALRFDGLPLDALFSVRRIQGAPEWELLEEVARMRGGASLEVQVRGVRETQEALIQGQSLSLGRALDSSATRQWLASRLPRVSQGPSSSSGNIAKVVVVLGLVYALSGGSDRK